MPTIVLASTSPRRIELLTLARVRFETRAPNADESPKKGERPAALVKRLARDKANCVSQDAQDRHGHVIVIAADTIVVSPNGKTVLGKPKDAKDALRMVTLLAGKTHTVLTGYCLREEGRPRGKSRIVQRIIKSRVKLRKLSAAQIRDYVLSGESMDKAGAYAAQGLGMTLVESISGSYTNVVGLPMAQLIRDLEQLT